MMRYKKLATTEEKRLADTFVAQALSIGYAFMMRH